MTKTAAWYWGNIQLLAQLMPNTQINYDTEECTWIYIDRFPMPANVLQDHSRLLLTLPGLNAPITMQPKAFYLDQGLRGASGRWLGHIFESGASHGCEDLSHLGYSWACLLLRRWRPTYDVVSGDNLATVTNTIFQKLKEL